MSLLEICLFQGEIGSTDQHMLQKLIIFFFGLVICLCREDLL